MHRPFLLPGRPSLPRATVEKIRGRSVRARLKKLVQFVGPLRTFFFIFSFVALSYLAVNQLRLLIFSTSYFELRNIEVFGIKNLKREEVVKLAGISPNMNIFNIDKENIKARLLLHPMIKTANVKLNGLYTLEISIQERTGIMYCKWGTSFWEIAEDGTILSSSNTISSSLPLITGINLGDRRIGDSLQNLDEFFVALEWVKKLSPEIFQTISEINFKNPENPYVILECGVKIIPRELEDFKNRHFFLRALLDNLRKNKVEPEYLDLRAPDKIVLKPRAKNPSAERGLPQRVGG